MIITPLLTRSVGLILTEKINIHQSECFGFVLATSLWAYLWDLLSVCLTNGALENIIFSQFIIFEILLGDTEITFLSFY